MALTINCERCGGLKRAAFSGTMSVCIVCGLEDLAALAEAAKDNCLNPELCAALDRVVERIKEREKEDTDGS